MSGYDGFCGGTAGVGVGCGEGTGMLGLGTGIAKLWVDNCMDGKLAGPGSG